MAGFVVIGLCGIALNVVIGKFYDAAALGIFNQVFAAYIVFSQLASGGIHYSVLRAVTEFKANRAERGSLLSAAIVSTAVLAAIFSLVFWLSRDIVGGLLGSPGAAEGIGWAAPGLFLFALNKVLMGTVNGMNWMRTFAVLQVIRSIAMVSGLWVVSAWGWPAGRLPFALTIGEAAVFVCALPAVGRLLCWSTPTVVSWMKSHLRFGLRSFASGLIVELNTRIDVLVLGLFVGDSTVGIYSFAAVLAEGACQMLAVLRNSYNPKLAELLMIHDYAALRALTARGKKVTYAMTSAVGIVSVAAFPLAAAWLTHEPEFRASWPLFATLIIGIVVSSGYMPFSQLLLQAGRPLTHTFLTSLVVLANAVGNVALIPLWHAEGAAVATAASFVVNALGLVVISRKVIGPVL
jgi:O-antigen/teichoic acid export membrane protein